MNRITFLKIQILETEKLLEMVKEHPIMFLSLKESLDSFKEELTKLEEKKDSEIEELKSKISELKKQEKLEDVSIWDVLKLKKQQWDILNKAKQ